MDYVIYLPNDNRQVDALAQCLSYAEQHPEWRSIGVVIGRWDDVIDMMARDVAQVVLIAERSHLPPDRLPRIVSVEEESAVHHGGSPSRPTQRRPHPLS